MIGHLVLISRHPIGKHSNTQNGLLCSLMQVVGCDKTLRSKKVFDRCLNCGGDGGSCVLTRGTYTKHYKVYGKEQL